MRILFVSTTTVGGSGRSQRQLAKRLVERGHEVSFLVDLEQPERIRRWAYGHLSDVSARLGRRPGSSIVRWLEGMPGRRVGTTEIDGIAHLTSPIPENAAQRVLESVRPDVVIGSSILRLTWRKVHELCSRADTATVLYVREIAAMNHFTVGAMPAEAIVANAGSLARSVEEAGYPCSIVPSVIESGTTSGESSRLVALVINPIPTHGIELVWLLARRLPQIPFVIQQSWPLDDATLASLELTAAGFPNVEFRKATPSDPTLYRDARVLLAPHRIDNRPRVIAEAQANGIPTIASQFPGLAEAVGDGGLLLGMDDVDGWVSAIQQVWFDHTAYELLVERALAHSRREEIDPQAVTTKFEQILNSVERRATLF